MPNNPELFSDQPYLGRSEISPEKEVTKHLKQIDFPLPPALLQVMEFC